MTTGTYTLLAEDSTGRTVVEKAFYAKSEHDARQQFWATLSDVQKDAIASIECVDYSADLLLNIIIRSQ